VQTVVSVSYHYKNPNYRVGLVQSGPQHVGHSSLQRWQDEAYRYSGSNEEEQQSQSQY
jgi:hypothetical protein